MASRVVEFLRPTFYGLIAFGLLVGVVNLIRHFGDASSRLVDRAGLPAAELAGLDLTDVVFPDPKLRPEEVVKFQIAGLSSGEADGVGILQCFCFASPANRAVTGPLERFGQMVRQDPYLCMAHPRSMLIGRPQQEDDVARLLVTVIDQESNVRAFTFVLARQQAPPFAGCWMTEAVLPALPPPPAAPPQSSPPPRA